MSNTSRKTIEVSERRSDEALRHIVALIFEGRLSPGARLPAERDLAEQIGVSRATLRDAVNRLEARGYIERRSKSGNYVSTVIPQSVSEPIEDVVDAGGVGFADIIEIRKILELWAVAKAAESPTEDALRSLRGCLETMRSTAKLRTDEQFERHSKADLQFHQTIAEMTGNPLYMHLFHFFSNLVSRSIQISKQLIPGDFGNLNIEVHEQVFQAINERDVARSKRSMLAHFLFVEKHLAPNKFKATRKSAHAPAKKPVPKAVS
ncbi:MAG TPA: FadR/GntR family transcriptional regulator [Pyrinomonadaceae bacterium]|nr:FadR/GntR family transcriptional regulator [Pyrinomonadaceae bacterium]